MQASPPTCLHFMQYTPIPLRELREGQEIKERYSRVMVFFLSLLKIDVR
jgi:hypothetical protein